jgi:hypothetical protein
MWLAVGSIRPFAAAGGEDDRAVTLDDDLVDGENRWCDEGMQGRQESIKQVLSASVRARSRCGADDVVDPVLVEDAQALNDPASEEVVDKPLGDRLGIRHDAIPFLGRSIAHASMKRRLNGAYTFGSRMPGAALMTSGITAIADPTIVSW